MVGYYVGKARGQKQWSKETDRRCRELGPQHAGERPTTVLILASATRRDGNTAPCLFAPPVHQLASKLVQNVSNSSHSCPCGPFRYTSSPMKLSGSTVAL